MSTNPFRRSSLKGPGNNSTLNFPSTDVRGSSPGPLSVDTRVPATSQKHVNFASPPAIPISPVSYPSSPEATRQEFPSSFTNLDAYSPQATNYSHALASDPFAAEASDGEDHGAIEQALENTKANAAASLSVGATVPISKEGAVKDTLGRFASGPRKTPAAQEPTLPGRQALDVDAFTKLLLTGESGASSSRSPTVQTSQGIHGLPVSESSSSADTASISQHSIFETVPPAQEESPRSSYEADSNEAGEHRANFTTATESKKKPPPPKSRRGKPLRDSANEQASKQNFNTFINSLSISSSRNASSETVSLNSPHFEQSSSSVDKASDAQLTEPSQKRVPPTLPLARRKSQLVPSKPELTRSSSSRQSVLSESDAPPSPLSTSSGFKIPPPPPARRTSDRRPSFDVQRVSENTPTPTLEPPAVEALPELSLTPSYQKRMSQGLPPPIPPPRRGRGSSRSSVDTQRPSMATLGVAETGDHDVNSPNENNDNIDILADLAALRREVDAARAGAG